MTTWLSHPTASVFVAEREGEPCGFLLAALSPALAQDWRFDAEILAIAVRPRDRGQGVGGHLLDAALAWARGRASHLPLTRVVLSTAVDNVAAQRLFATRGFRHSGRRQHLYADGTDAFRMVLPLPRFG